MSRTHQFGQSRAGPSQFSLFIVEFLHTQREFGGFWYGLLLVNDIESSLQKMQNFDVKVVAVMYLAKVRDEFFAELLSIRMVTLKEIPVLGYGILLTGSAKCLFVW